MLSKFKASTKMIYVADRSKQPVGSKIVARVKAFSETLC